MTLFVFAMMMDMAAAGDCTGARCGCFKNSCWAYVDQGFIRPGDWWCYTQTAKTPKGQSKWQSCKTNSDCWWDRTCGNCRQYKGKEEASRDLC